VGSQRLTAWATARPNICMYLSHFLSHVAFRAPE
jgi:hypothetical protein